MAGAVVIFGVAWFLDRRRRSYADTPTTPAAAVFSGRNEVAGTVRTPDSLVSHRTQTPCVWWRYHQEEERTHTRTVTDTDSQGRTTSRTETYTQWHTIERLGGDLETFLVVDDTGEVQVRMAGATTVPQTLVSEVVRQDLGGGGGVKGFFAKIGDNRTGRYRYTEEGIVVGAEVFVVGEARLREDIVAPEIADGPGKFLISTRSEASHTTRLAVAVPILVILAGIGLALGSYYALADTGLGGSGLAVVPGIALWILLLTVGWTVITYNRLRLVGEAARRAWSLIEVQLARRRDLIAPLVEIAKQAAAHETSTQTAVASARSFEHLAVDEAKSTADEQTAALRPLVMRLESFPAMAANGTYLNVMDQLADTETRIAAARTFYNDSVTITRDRSRQFPGVVVARFMSLPKPDLFAADGLDLKVR